MPSCLSCFFSFWGRFLLPLWRQLLCFKLYSQTQVSTPIIINFMTFFSKSAYFIRSVQMLHPFSFCSTMRICGINVAHACRMPEFSVNIVKHGPTTFVHLLPFHILLITDLHCTKAMTASVLFISYQRKQTDRMMVIFIQFSPTFTFKTSLPFQHCRPPSCIIAKWHFYHKFPQ